MSSELSSLISRLEKATVKLELMAGISIESKKPSVKSSDFVKAFDEFISKYVDSYVSASQKCHKSVAEHAMLVKAAFYSQKAFLVMASECQKPKDSDLQKTIQPQCAAIESVVSFGTNSKDFQFKNFLTAVSDSIPDDQPVSFVQSTSEPGAFYANRVLNEAKGKDEAACEWVKTIKVLWQGLAEYVQAYHKTEQGCEMESCTKPENTVSSQPKQHSVTAPKHDLFAELNKGGSVTQGLKKVDKSEMTHKNPNLRASSVVSEKKATTTFSSSSKQPNEPQRDPSYDYQPSKKHDFSYFKGKHNLKVDNPQPQENIVLFKCENCTIQIKEKCNNIILNNCKKVAVVFDTAIACVELNNSQGCQVQINGKVPLISMDKVDSCQVFLSKDSLDAQIITAKTSEININVPGATEQDDFTEISLPEQYISVFDHNKKTFVTETVSHG